MGPRSAAVVWTLPVSAACSVVVADASGNSTAFPASMSRFASAATGLGGDYYQYRAMLNSLEPGAVYTCHIQADGQPLAWPLRNPLQFRTAADGPFSFLHFADSGDGGDAQVQLSLRMAREDVSLVLANGDLAYDLATY
ncbi:MAG: fibronectin type III domain-containing protein, partial [Bryobacterales bacterium]|nr:fibronectin type III domain-containing protein [Bryobacterales bacterium]